MTMLELSLLGAPRAQRDGVEVRFDTRKALALLAVLAVTEREHSRETLAALLWPDLDRTRARATLRRTLSVATAVGPALETTASGVRLDADQTRCDVTRFRMLVDASEPASWARAVDLAAGAFLEGFSLRDSPAFEEWQLATADALRDQLSQTLGRLVAHEVSAGRLDAALGHARRRTQIEPLSEPAHADLIRVTAWSGDRPGALTAYRALVRLLDRELGVPPLPETLALNEAIRAGTLAPPLGSGPAPAIVAALPPVALERLEGRDLELARVDERWAAGQGCAGVSGDRGIGKTALIAEFARRRADEGVPVLRLAGHDAERALAYATANDLVRGMIAQDARLVSRLGPAARPLAVLASEVEADGSPSIRNAVDLERVHEAVRAALASFGERGRTLIIVDDADLVDAPSAALLAYLVRRLPFGVLLIAAWTAPGGGGSSLVDAVQTIGEVIALPALDLPAVSALVAGTPHDPVEVLRRTRGIPMLVREYATSGAAAAEIPAEVRDVVAARFDGASPTTKQVVGAAAVIGTVADPELLRVACGRDEGETVDAIEEAIARGLLVERADRPGYDVPHDLVRDVALDRLSLARARLLHGRIAEVLARRHGVDPFATPAGAVARHLVDAGRDEDAATWFLLAADEASRVSAHAEALAQLEALRATGHHALDAHERIGTTLVRLGRYGDALVSLDRAGALAEDDPVRQAAIEHAIAGIYDRRGDPVLAQAHLEAARELAGDDPDGRPARIAADLALVLHRRGEAAEAERTAAGAAQLAEALGDVEALTQAQNVLGVIASARGSHSAAQAQLSAAVDGARALGDLDLLIAALNNLSRAHQAAGSEQDALVAAREALEQAERQGDRHRLAALHSHLADLLHAAGRDDEAVAQLKSSASAFADVQDAQSRPELWTLTEW